MEMLTRPPRRSSPFQSFRDDVNELFASVFPGRKADDEDAPSALWSPRMDVTETEDTDHLSIDLPDLLKDDLPVDRPKTEKNTPKNIAVL